jgi:hypothetical protein
VSNRLAVDEIYIKRLLAYFIKWTQPALSGDESLSEDGLAHLRVYLDECRIVGEQTILQHDRIQQEILQMEQSQVDIRTLVLVH